VFLFSPTVKTLPDDVIEKSAIIQPICSGVLVIARPLHAKAVSGEDQVSQGTMLAFLYELIWSSSKLFVWFLC
jgi:hypothetical protein